MCANGVSQERHGLIYMWADQQAKYIIWKDNFIVHKGKMEKKKEEANVHSYEWINASSFSINLLDDAL